MERIFLIDGHVETNGISHDKFHDELIKWIEKKGWSFCGITSEVKDDDET